MFLSRILVLGSFLAFIVGRWWPYTRYMPLPCLLPVGNVDVTHLPVKSATSFSSLPLNDALEKHGMKLYQHEIQGVESVAIDEDGDDLYLIDRYGYVLRANMSSLFQPGMKNISSVLQDGGLPPRLEMVGYVGPGRPLGYHVYHGNIFVCDSLKGLVRFSLETRELEILVNRAGARDSKFERFHGNVNYANDLDISRDGNTIYFTDSGDIAPALNREGYYDTMMSYILTALQGEPRGRVLAYHLREKSVEVLASRVWFANGIAISEDESFLVIAETCSRRLLKLHLKGEKEGSSEILIDGLQGYPDGISRASDGNFWVALIAQENPFLNFITKSKPFIRWAVSWLQQYWTVPIGKFGCVMKVGREGA